MQQKKIPLRLRLAAAIAGKAYIPSLDLHDTLVAGASNHIKSYSSKGEALTANVGWAYTANDAITKPASDVKLQLYRKQPDGEREEIFTHEILDLLNRPNFAHTGKQLRKLHFTYLNFVGESYTLMMKGDKPFIPAKGQLPDSLHLLPAHLASFELGDSYLQSTVKYENNTYPIASIIRGLDPSPRNPYYGQSKIAAAAATIDTDEQMKDWNRRFFANNARPGLIFNFNEEMSPEAHARLKEQFADQHTGTDNAYKNVMIEKGEIKPYMLTQQDLDFLKSREFTRDEIFAMFHVSPAAVGMIKDANRSIMDGAIYIHTVQNVVPRLEDLVELYNTTLVQVYDPTLELDFENPVAEDSEQKLKEAEKAVNKWMTIDEVRAQYGMEALPDGLGAQIYGESRLAPLSTIAAATEAQDTSDDDEEPEDPNPEDDPDEPVADAPTTDPADKSIQTKSADDDRQARGNSKADDYTIKASRYEETMLQTLRTEFEKQRARVLGNLETAQMPTKGYTKKDWINDLVEWDGFDDEMAEALKPLIAIVVTETGQSAIKDVGLSPSQFNPYTDPIKQFMDQRSTKIAKDVNDETEKQLRATLSQGLQAGETSFELRARVEQVFGSALTVRADRIARTESARAQTFGDIEAWDQSGVVEAKEWFTAHDDRQCKFCRPMDGKVIGIKTNFFRKGDVWEGDDGKTITLDYDDIQGPPMHNNCRCTLLPILLQAES